MNVDKESIVVLLTSFVYIAVAIMNVHHLLENLIIEHVCH